MSQLSIKYADPRNADEFLFFTRNFDFSKIVIYQQGKVIQTMASAKDFRAGVTFRNDADQEIHVRVLNQATFQLFVKVDDLDYIRVDERSVEYQVEISEEFDDANVRPIAKLFILALAIQLINFMELSEVSSIGFLHRSSLSNVIEIYNMGLIALIIVSYMVTIYYLHDNRGWAYFLGFPVLLIFTILEVYHFFNHDGSRGIDYSNLMFILIFVKVVLSLILLTRMGRVFQNFKEKDSDQQADVID